MSENKHIVFVSYELHPINDGGCGVFIWSAVKEILKHINNVRITLLLDISKNEVNRFNKEFKRLLPNFKQIDIYTVSDILEEVKIDSDFSDYNNIYLWKSHQFYYALRWLYSKDPFDYLEFFDYAGAAYFSTLAHKYENQFHDCRLSIRAHCTIDLMDIEQKQVDFNYEKILMYQMEKDSLKAADFILVPSQEWGDLYKKRYGLDPKKLIISPPPIDPEKIPEYKLDETKQDILYYGRLFELKGVEIFIDAAVTFLDENPTSNNCFYLVGYSGMSITGKQMKEALKERIPERHLNRFVFTGQVDRKQLSNILKSIGFAVFPNYVESFCYSIHELYLSGVPIICGYIPAFEKFEDLKNCIKFDGGSYDLAQKMKLLSNSFEMRKKICKPYSILDDAIFISSYRYIFDFEKKPIHKDVTGKVSLVIFDDGVRHEEIIKHKIIDPSTSYLLSKKATKQGSTSIFLFGELWYVKPLVYNENSNWFHLPLNDYFWFGRSSDIVDNIFFDIAVACLENHLEIDFVGSFSVIKTTKALEKLCIPMSLSINDKTYQINDLLRSVIRNTDEKNLREVYDIRFSYIAQKAGLSTGYTIPEFLMETINSADKQEVHSVNEERTLLVHQSTRFKEWDPFTLYPTLNSKKQVRPYWQQTLRRFYHKTREFSNRSNFVLINKIINRLHRLYMKHQK